MESLEDLRRQVNAIDADIIAAIARRQQVTQQIGEYKKQRRLSVINNTREDNLRAWHQHNCEQHHVSETLVAQIFAILIAESRKAQL